MPTPIGEVGSSPPRRLRRQRSRTILRRLTLMGALAVAAAGSIAHSPPALFAGLAWMAGVGLAPRLGLHAQGGQVLFGCATAGAGVFVYALLFWPPRLP